MAADVRVQCNSVSSKKVYYKSDYLLAIELFKDVNWNELREKNVEEIWQRFMKSHNQITQVCVP